ncbi:MAG TPA: ABC transporter substrate-binding protein [Thermoanaerobaculia bacterium]|nr:ABC transporter substrate-binding protein [Thermoanaerobaculia bacterium]
MKRLCTAAVVLALVPGVLSLAACRRKEARRQDARLVVLTTFVPFEIDPYHDTRHRSRDVYVNVFEPLVKRDAAGELLPCLAESWTNLSPDVATFRLREGVSFHDGSPLTTGDVVASLKRAQGRESAVAGYMAGVVEVSTAEPRTVRVRTKGPQASLVLALSSVPITKQGAAGAPMGTGPYRVVGFEPGEKVRLARFERYAGAAPELGEATFEKAPDAQKERERLAASTWAVALDPPEEVCGWAARDRRYVATSQYLRGALTYLAFGFAHESPFRDLRVRRAVRAALDARGLIEAGAPHGGLAATQLLPPGVFGFDASLRAPARDLDAARGLLRDAGYPRGFTIDLDANVADGRLAETVAAQLSEAGLDVRPVLLPSERFRAKIDGESTFYLYNWVVGGEAEGALRNFLHTRDPEKGWGSRNRTAYSNRELDAALEEAVRTIGPAERLQMLQRCMRLLNDDLPWIPLYSPRIGRVRSKTINLPERPDDRLVLSEITLAR